MQAGKQYPIVLISTSFWFNIYVYLLAIWIYFAYTSSWSILSIGWVFYEFATVPYELRVFVMHVVVYQFACLFVTPDLKDLEKKQSVPPCAFLFCTAMCKTRGDVRILVFFLFKNGKDFSSSQLGMMLAVWDR